MICPKCQSVNTYVIDGMNACRNCGWRGLPPGTEPYKVRRHWEKNEEEIMIEKGCSNCHRDMDTRYGGHCVACYNARKGLTKGTPEYDAALAAIREKVQGKKVRASNKNAKLAKSEPRKKATAGSTDAAVIDHLKEQRDEFMAKAKKLDQAIELLS